MRTSVIAILTYLFLTINAYANNIEKLYYLTPDITDSSFSNEQLQQIKARSKAIDILAPQLYQLDEQGTISGNLDLRLLALAKETHLKIMPLIVNQNFNQETFHHFLHNSDAQQQALVEMLNLCIKNHFTGLQFDFENIQVQDKNALSHFVQLAAETLHKKNFLLSVAVVPHIADALNSQYDRWYYENWSGAYDYQSLAKSADFITIMSYDQHSSLTTPGPIAALDWVEKTLQELLKVVPASKVSLGIPDYSGYWFTGKTDPGNVAEKFIYRSKESQISYARVLSLLDAFQQTLSWQAHWQSSYVIVDNHAKNEYLFVEDAKSFRAKVALAERYQLRGISVWKFGLEDPQIWDVK